MTIAAGQSAGPRFLFGTDSHDGFRQIRKFVVAANAKNPDLVVLGGDLTELGTAREHRAVAKAFSGLAAPVEVIKGNHDLKGKEAQRFAADYGIGDRSFDRQGVHFVMIDNADQTISDRTFAFLERDLAQNPGKPTVVVMHVPAVGPAPSKAVAKLNKLAPKTIASPIVKDPAQAKRFTDLMSQYRVDLVLSGHTHAPFDATVGGVRYVTAGAVGGKISRRGVGHEYLDIAFRNGRFQIRHVPLDAPTGGRLDVTSRMASSLYQQAKAMVTGRPAVAKSDAGALFNGMRHTENAISGAIVRGSHVDALKRAGYRVYGATSSGKHGDAVLDNVGELAPSVVRGAQPSEAAIATLKQQGIDTVINLRPEAQWEKDLVEKAGLKYVHLPLPALGAPTNEQAVSFLREATNPANGKVFFHCLHGADRTGAMAAVYRMAAQGWSADKAIAEMPDYGFHAGFQDSKTTFVKGFESFWKGLEPAMQRDILHLI